jgi:hypothetical protein
MPPYPINELTFSHGSAIWGGSPWRQERDRVTRAAAFRGWRGPRGPRTRCPRVSAITRPAAASRRCKADSRMPNPATRADRARKTAGAADRGAPRAGGYITIDGGRREITNGEAVTRLVDKSPIDMLRRAKKKAGVAPRPEPARSSGGRGGDADLHHKAAAILGGGTSRGARKTAVSMTGHPAARHALP